MARARVAGPRSPSRIYWTRSSADPIQGDSPMPRIRTRLAVLMLAALAALFVAACGGDDDSGGGGGGATDPQPGSLADVGQKDRLILYNKARPTAGRDKPAFPPYFVDNDPTNGKGFESAVAYA